MSLFQGLWRLIFGSQDEQSSKPSASSSTPPVSLSTLPSSSCSPSSSRTTPPVASFKSTVSSPIIQKAPSDYSHESIRNPVFDRLPARTSPSNFSKSPAMLSAPFSQPNVGDSRTIKPTYIEKSSGRTNDAYENSRCSSPLPPTFSYTAFQSPSKPSQISSSPSPLAPTYTTPSSKPSQIFSSPSPPPSKSTTSSSKPSLTQLSPSSSSLKTPAHSSKPSASSSTPPVSSSVLPPFSFSPSSSRTTPPIASFKSSIASPNTRKPPPDSSLPYSKPPPSSPSLVPSSSKPLPSSPNPTSSHKTSLASAKGPTSSPSQPPAVKQFLRMARSDATNIESKTSYVLGKGASSIYAIPEDIKALIKKDIVPEVLKQPLSPSSYKSFFAALLHAEDFYLEKWSNFQLKNVSLQLHEASIYKRSNKSGNYNRNVEKDDRDDRTFVVFEIDSIAEKRPFLSSTDDSVPEKRPFLLSRDLVFARPSGEKVEPFQGLIHRVVKSTRVLVDFGDDFHSQHRPTRKYDISFSFNRVCLKRAHQAIEAASDSLFQNFLFPECTSRKNVLNPPAKFPPYHELHTDQFSAVHHILSIRGSPPYLLGGQLCVTRMGKALSRTGVVVREAVLEIYKTSPEHRILICAPLNSTCDVLTRSLKKVIPEWEMFRANAAFREVDGVLTEILSSCHMDGECFACPSLQELLRFRIVVSTFVSTFRLHNEGIAAGHFSHIFLVDASSATEPEVTIALANFADSNTAVVVTGERGDRSHWVRSEMARKYGLRKSYFERLHEHRSYRYLDPTFITTLVN